MIRQGSGAAIQRPQAATRLVLVISQLNIGGTERQLAQLAARLPRDEIQVTVVGLYGSGPVAEEIRAAGIPVVVLTPTASRMLPRMIRVGIATFSLYRCIRRIRPTIVHGFLYSAYIPATFAARLAGVPTVITSRRSTGFFKENRPVLRAVERLANHLTDMIVPNSLAVMRSVELQERVPSRKLRIVRNAVEVPRAEQSRDEVRAQFGVPRDAPCGVVIANLIGYKGHEHLLRALSFVRNHGRDVHVLLVGDGPKRLGLGLLTHELDIGGLVHFCGSQPNVGSFVSAADFGVLPSEHEGFSNAILEMMSAGLAVIATDVGGAAEVITNHENGLLVPTAQVEPLARAISRLVADAPFRAKLGVEAAARIARDFSYERMIAEMTDLYASLAGDVRNELKVR